ncbi:unnamed protein product [Moneuplotes crassus]|uniref:Uncharacterized protein n=1 Tax=Euplotes crassus TaxID=5936 RepID=A0AAD1X7W1_EUPCR|nr:unnamed protein product [Moneuplotes crassus]
MICNILPYFGYLDQNYQMMSQLCKESRECWMSNEAAFCLKALTDRRRQLAFAFTYSEKINDRTAKDIIKFIQKFPILYKIFKLPNLKFTSGDEVNNFLKFADKINNEFLRFTHVNFDDCKLEQKFYEDYSALLDSKGLEEKKQQIHTYYSSKGVMINLANPNMTTKLDLSIPQVLAIALMNPETNVSSDELDQLDPKLKSHVTSLGINYLKNDNDYMGICSRVKVLVNWFDNIENLKFSFLEAPPSCVNNILLNFSGLVNTIEIKVNKNHLPRTTIEAKNCYLQCCYYSHQKMEAENKVFFAKKVTFASPPEGLNNNKEENWQNIKDFSFLRIEGIRELEIEESNVLETQFRASLDHNHFCVTKRDIVGASTNKFLDSDVLEQFPNAMFTFDISKKANDSMAIERSVFEEAKKVEEYDDSTLFGILSLRTEFGEIEPILQTFASKNLIYLEIELLKSEKSSEVTAIQALHKIIQDNDTLREIEVSLHNETSVISILDSCENKPNIDCITIASSQDLSKRVKSHVQEYKKRNIFKTVKVYISEVKAEKSRCIIF